ncbi:uncharacterized protein V6R79_018865 [Siganus canaliculatus]
MPKSDTWPGGTGLETLTGMDSAGSCDSVDSANSGLSDDSLEHLSAEEKACLMFLEETIESLDTEEDSGLSNDEPELPSPVSLATKLADQSTSMSKNPNQNQAKSDTKPTHSYQQPENQAEGAHKHKQKSAAPPVPLEVNVVIPPPLATKPQDLSMRTADSLLPRGPLSYEALVHLRKSASIKKTPLCPTVDHTIESDKPPPATAGGPKPKPALLPKPKNAHVSHLKMQNKAAESSSDPSLNVKHATDAQVVRLEALQKLGLLSDQQPENDTTASSESPSSLDPHPNRVTRGPSKVHPSRSTSFCHSQIPSEPKVRSLQSSTSFQDDSTQNQQSVSASHQVQSSRSTVGSNGTASQHITTGEAQSAAHKPSNAVGYTVMVVPGMGNDRKEALRKLGLLKA